VPSTITELILNKENTEGSRQQGAWHKLTLI
jgi:hypothetical protein